ncbi:CocE/NonD family hydrolase [Leptolyngbya sp. FACHB-16]|uniref:CocE/NonD family hydrolase n=1 Tax=unclassified Leptolyngbya TaxID=2650499 RepID=UPI001689DCF3|nr:CocE/NonD family hydrolase [Leptolyngbya sp. FACHB-16]MBD2158906.1 CocE/NonD family hydrolase [Leptolyngbya sp. FACHB-16]
MASKEPKKNLSSNYQNNPKSGYNGWSLTSQYITVRDGVKLAADIFRPVQDRKIISNPLPVIWTHHRYHRSSTKEAELNEKCCFLKQLIILARRLVKEEANLQTQLDVTPWLERLIKCGYIIGVVDVRGGGASYGTYTSPFSKEEANDAYDVTEWFAEQVWCNKNIGMFGDSYMGITQYMAASTMPPHLKVIFSEMAVFDLYEFTYPGGIFRHDFVAKWSNKVKELDSSFSVAPVTQDKDRKWLTEALQEHKKNRDVFEMFENLPYRNSQDKKTRSIPQITRSPSSHLKQINQSGVAIFHLSGWHDMWCRDALLWFNNLSNPQKIVIGPWSHSQRYDFDQAVEHLLWYDYWLKGIENGTMESAPIRYYTFNAPKGKEWQVAWTWPLPHQQLTKYYLQGGPSGSIDSINDGVLTTQSPQIKHGWDDYIVNYTTTSGKATRWTNGYGGNFDYGDMSENDRKSLTYTTAPLAKALQITGHPLIHLWITSTASDGDFFVYLEDVDRQKVSRYLTEGALRASHRAISTPPYNNFGLPYHQSFESEIITLSDYPTELNFDLHPISYIFKAGHQIRLTIACTDKDNALTPELSPPPTISLYRSIHHTSYITLPIISED